MPNVRLKSDSVKSPHVPNTTIVSPNPIHSPMLRKVKKWESTIAAMTQNMAPPMEPSHDFLGEIRSNRRCFPNSIPVQYAPVSFIQVKMKMDKGKTGLYCETLVAALV